MIKVFEIPEAERENYYAWIRTPGLVIPTGKTSVQYFIETRMKQQSLEVFK